MKKPESGNGGSTVTAALALVGDFWSLLIIREAMLGATRFDQFHARLGIARNILSARMKRLVAAEIFTKAKYLERPLRYEYLLTERGKDLFAIMVALRAWGDRWAADGIEPHVRVTHRDCGGELFAHVGCSQCGGSISSLDSVDISLDLR